MNRLTQELTDLLMPKAALIVYKNESNEYFLELRSINKTGEMGEAFPVTYDFMNQIAKNYTESHDSIPYGKVPPQMLYCDVRKGHEKYVWYNKPGKHMMYFKPGLGLENGEYDLPGIIFMINSEYLHVYAYKDKKIHEKTQLYEAPFFNVYSDGKVCLGNTEVTRPDNPDFTAFIEYCEKTFWLSEFSHLIHSRNPTKSNLVLVTKACKDAPFNYEELQPLNKTLKDILK